MLGGLASEPPASEAAFRKSDGGADVSATPTDPIVGPRRVDELPPQRVWQLTQDAKRTWSHENPPGLGRLRWLLNVVPTSLYLPGPPLALFAGNLFLGSEFVPKFHGPELVRARYWGLWVHGGVTFRQEAERDVSENPGTAWGPMLRTQLAMGGRLPGSSAAFLAGAGATYLPGNGGPHAFGLSLAMQGMWSSSPTANHRIWTVGFPLTIELFHEPRASLGVSVGWGRL